MTAKIETKEDIEIDQLFRNLESDFSDCIPKCPCDFLCKQQMKRMPNGVYHCGCDIRCICVKQKCCDVYNGLLGLK